MAVRAGDGTDLRVRVSGPEGAPTVVLVHGWTCALEFWTLQLQALAGRLRLVAYDLRGHGGSAPSSGGDYSIEAYRDDLDAVLRATVPVGARPVLVGHSLGAMTIVAWAAERRERGEDVGARIAAAGLLNTGVGDLITSSLVLPARGLGAKLEQELGQLVLGSRMPMPRRTTPISSRAVRYVALAPAASPATVAFCERMVLACPRDVRANTGSTLSRLDLQAGLEALTVPTVVVSGRADRLTPPVHAERMAERLPRLVRHLELPDVGHMGPVEAPEAVTAAIEELVAAAGYEAPAGGRGAM
ncbi:alpha/beta fold hydrolase, partial [Patulibacter sp. S7RM1-6]